MGIRAKALTTKKIILTGKGGRADGDGRTMVRPYIVMRERGKGVGKRGKKKGKGKEREGVEK